MRKAFLGPDAGNDFAVGIQPGSVPFPVTLGDLLAQVLDPVGHGVAVVPGVLEGLGHLLLNERVRRIGRIAHPQIDDIDARHPLLVLQLVDLAEQIGRQSFDAIGHRDAEGGVGERDVGFAAHCWRSVQGGDGVP